MSAFVLIYNRDGAPVSPDVLAESMRQLDRRGHDGKQTFLRDNLACGIQYFQTVPEGVSGLDQTDVTILFDGRLDNRAEVISRLGLDRHEAVTFPDAALVQEMYCRYGEAGFADLIGPLAAVIYDHRQQRIILARDPLGLRTLFYYIDDRLFIAASEAPAVLAHPQVDRRLNRHTVALWCGLEAPASGETFYEDIFEVRPAHCVTVGGHSMNEKRFWDIDPEKRIRYRRPEDYTEHFLELFGDGVRACLRAVDPPAVLMSGGYDSALTAAVAARELGEPLHTISWTFDELASCDERPAIEALNAHSGAVPHYLPADDAYPLNPATDWTGDENQPVFTPFKLLFERAYTHLHRLDKRVLLTGFTANQLFSGGEYRLLDHLRAGHMNAVLAGLTQAARKDGLSHLPADPSVQRLGEWLLDTIPGGRRIRPKRPIPASRLYTAALQELLRAHDQAANLPPVQRPAQYKTVLGTFATRLIAGYNRHAAHLGIDLRSPYHNRRLVEFMLAIPAYVLRDGRHSKLLLYRAAEGLLPDSVRESPGRGILTPLFNRGLAQAGELVEKPDALWQDYLHADRLKTVPAAGNEGEMVTLWQCLALEKWRGKYRSG